MAKLKDISIVKRSKGGKRLRKNILTIRLAKEQATEDIGTKDTLVTLNTMGKELLSKIDYII